MFPNTEQIGTEKRPQGPVIHMGASSPTPTLAGRRARIRQRRLESVHAAADQHPELVEPVAAGAGNSVPDLINQVCSLCRE
jgi:hypothetical protein